jgi:DNA-binding beta-propeller fold protein YncE
MKKMLWILLLMVSLATSATYSVKTFDMLKSSGLSINGGGPLLVRVDSVRNRILVANTLTSSLTVIDGATQRVRAIPLASRVPQHLKAECWTLNEKNGDVYIIGHKCFFHVRVQEGQSRQIMTDKQYESIAVDDVYGTVFLAGRESKELAFYDPAKAKLTPLPWTDFAEPMANQNATPPPAIRKAVVDPVLHRVLALDGYTSRLFFFDSKNGKQLSSHELLLSKGGRWHLAGYDLLRHTLYLVIETSDRRVVEAARIRADNGTVAIEKLPELREGVGMIYNPNREEIYIPYDNAACVHVVDFKTPVQEIPLPTFGNDATALDPAAQRLYVASWPQGDVEVVDVANRRFVKRIEHKGILPHMFTIAFNPHDGLLYIPKGATAVNGAFGAAITTLDPVTEQTAKIYTGWLPKDLVEWKNGESMLVFNNEDKVAELQASGSITEHPLPIEYPIQACLNSAGDVYLSYGAHQSYWPTVYIWDAKNGVLSIRPDFSMYDRRIVRQAQKMVLDNAGCLHFTQNPWGSEEQFLGNLPDPVRLFEIGTRITLADKVDRETTQRLLQYDAELNRLYIARVAEKDSDPGVLQVVDVQSKKVLHRTTVGLCPSDLAFDEHNIYVCNFLSATVSVIDKKDFTAQEVRTGRTPLKVASLQGKSYVIHHLDNTLAELGAAKSVRPIPAKGYVDQILAWDSCLLLTVHSSERLTVLLFDPAADTFQVVLEQSYPFGDTSFATTNSSFYMTGQYGDVVYSLNQAKVDRNGRLWLTDFLSGKVFLISKK